MMVTVGFLHIPLSACMVPYILVLFGEYKPPQQLTSVELAHVLKLLLVPH